MIHGLAIRTVEPFDWLGISLLVAKCDRSERGHENLLTRSIFRSSDRTDASSFPINGLLSAMKKGSSFP